jgi:hypothetical protein
VAFHERHYSQELRSSSSEDLKDSLAPISGQDALLAFFDDELAQPGPVPIGPSVMQSTTPLIEPLPLTMTALQQLAAADSPMMDDLERTWVERRRIRRSESVMLNAALYVSAVFIIGAFAFVQLEDSVATNREAADREWVAAMNERQDIIAQDERKALATARLALTLPRWTEFLSYIKDGRNLLPKIRDHYASWSYAPFSDPDLRVIDRVEDAAGLASVHLRVDGSTDWASTIVMRKVNGTFKLDWDAFQRRFENSSDPQNSLSSEFRLENAFLGDGTVLENPLENPLDL